MIVLGITGAIASGKTTVAAVFAEAGVPVFNADVAVHDIYDNEPAAIAELFPAASAGGRIDRRRLAALISQDPTRIAALEQAIHPMVQARELAFIEAQRSAGERLAVLEIPLLYETGSDRLCDCVLVVTAPEDVRAARVTERGRMSAELYRQLLARQLPLAEKERRADFVVDSSTELGALQAATRAIMDRLLTAADRDRPNA